MTITTTDPTSATQRATWHLVSADGTYIAAVTRTSRKDSRGATGWAWELGYGPVSGVGFHYTGAEDHALIYAPMTDDPVEVLETLAGFVGAWDEAVKWGYEDSENRDLFPKACLPFLTVAELFASDTMKEED